MLVIRPKKAINHQHILSGKNACFVSEKWKSELQSVIQAVGAPVANQGRGVTSMAHAAPMKSKLMRPLASATAIFSAVANLFLPMDLA